MRERNRVVPEERRIQNRVGINIGDIIIEPEDIYGGGVNAAARLEGLDGHKQLPKLITGVKFRWDRGPRPTGSNRRRLTPSVNNFRP